MLSEGTNVNDREWLCDVSAGNTLLKGN